MGMFDNIKIQEWKGGKLVATVGVSSHVFSGGEPHLNFSADAAVEGRTFVISVFSGSSDDLVKALVAEDALSRKGADRVILFLPYLPGARQDRGAPLTAEVMADLINTAYFDDVIAVDPHSWLMPSLIKNFTSISAVDVVPDSFFVGSGAKTIISPDAGAVTRAGSIAEKYGLPLVVASKQRDPDDHYRLKGYSCEKVTTEYAVVIDDICDGGGTFLALADAIDMDRDKLRLWTTHGIYAKGIDIINERYGMVGCTNSMPGSKKAQVQVDLTDVLVKTLKDLE